MSETAPSPDFRSLVLFVTDSHGLDFFVHAASVAMALSRSKPEVEEVLVRAVPVNPLHPAKSFLKRMRSPRRWRRRRLRDDAIAAPSDWPHEEVPLADFPWSDESQDASAVHEVFLDYARRNKATRSIKNGGGAYFLRSQNLNSAYNKYLRLRRLELQVDGVRLEFERVKIRLPLRARISALMVPFLVLAWTPIYLAGNRGRRRWQQRLLSTSWRGVPLGDVIASDALARTPLSYGRLQPSASLIMSALEATLIVERVLSLSPNPRSFSLAPEPIYRHSIVSRTVQSLGGKPLGYGMNGDFGLYCDWTNAKQIDLKGPVVRSASTVRKSVGHDPERIAMRRAWIEDRTSSRSAMIPSFAESLNPGAKEVLSEVTRSTAARVIVVFLHDFRDAQMYFGIDEFVDLYSWAEFVGLQASTCPDTLVIFKEHPADSTTANLTNQIALERLKRRLAPVGVLFLDGSSVLQDVIDAVGRQRLIGVSHHGTVAEELTWQEIPVIVSRVGPWGWDYEFCATWDTAAELARFIRLPLAELRASIAPQVLLSYLIDRYQKQDSTQLHDAIRDLAADFVPEFHEYARYWLADEILRSAGPRLLSEVIQRHSLSSRYAGLSRSLFGRTEE